jgi:hypothetical protein
MKIRIVNKKRNQFISSFKKLKQQFPEGNHKAFFTFDLLGYSYYCDCYFPGIFQQKKILFNAAFSTLRLHADDVVYDMVNDKMDELFPDRYENHFDWMEISDKNEWLNGPEENRYKDWPLEQKYKKEEEKIRQSILESGVEVQPFIEVLPNYEFGVGLHGVFDCNTFEKQNLTEIINNIKTYQLLEYSSPVLIGNKRKLYAADLEQIERITPLIIKSKSNVT